LPHQKIKNSDDYIFFIYVIIYIYHNV